MSEITQTELINAQIEYGARGTSNKDITRNILKEWRGSQPIKDMEEAEAYYKVQNTAIENKSRSYLDEDNKRIENPTLSNVKSKTAQYRKSVNQKYDFALAKPFVISCDDDNYKEKWEEFLNDKVLKAIQRTGKDGINKGIGWSYVWIDDKGNLDLLDIEPETIYPAWSDRAHTDLDAIVRDYSVTEYNNLSSNDIRKVEFWDREIVEKYIDYSQAAENSGGDLEPDTEVINYALKDDEIDRATIQQTHMSKKDGSGLSWERVPFIFFKGCDDELPLLNECKSDVDTYDMVKSKAIDSILDDIDAVLVVESISAEIGDLVKARKMVQNSRIMAIEPGGSAKFEKVNTDITAIAQQLEIIRKDIQDNTSTVDLTTIQLGTNPSGQSMKAFYESLNTWCNGFESQFRVYMENLKYFFDKWLSWQSGNGSFEELQAKEVTFTLDRDMMINESEIIENVVKLEGKISQETLDEMNPWVESHEKEQERREADLKREQEQQELYQFDKDVDKNDKNQEDLDENNALE
jgi:SPP1 family phage portal protein